MKLSRLYVIAAAALLVATPAFADGAPTIATINIQQVMQDSTAAKSVREQLESKQKAFQAEVSKSRMRSRRKKPTWIKSTACSPRMLLMKRNVLS